VEGIEIPGLLLPKRPSRSDPCAAPGRPRGVLALRVLLLTRPDRPSGASIQEQLSTQKIEYGEAIGQDQFIDVEPGASVMPEQVIDDMVSWLSRALHGASVPIRGRAQPEWSPTAIVARPVSGHVIIERAVRIGAENLFGIITEPQDAQLAPMPTVLFVNAGRLPHCGPASSVGRDGAKLGCAGCKGAARRSRWSRRQSDATG